MKFCSIFNNLSTTGWNMKKLTQCTHTHRGWLSNSTKSTARGTIAWKLSTWQRNKQMKTRGVSHCFLAIYIKKYLKAKEEVRKLMLSPTCINEKITYVYILKAKNSTPNLTSHRHPQVKLIARVSVAGVSPAHHWVSTPRTQKDLYQWMAITLHPTPSYILPETCEIS